MDDQLKQEITQDYARLFEKVRMKSLDAESAVALLLEVHRDFLNDQIGKKLAQFGKGAGEDQTLL